MLIESLKTWTCKHFGMCGGCTCVPAPDQLPAPAPYEQELQNKEAAVRTLLAALEVSQWDAIVPSPDLWYYRNKMEYAFGDWQESHLVLGLREAGRFDRIIDVEGCLLMSSESAEALDRVRRWAVASGLSGYHRRRHQGDLRYLVIREGKNTGQRMGILIADQTAKGKLADLEDLRKKVEPLFTTFWLGITDSLGDVARATEMRLLWGPGTLEETLGPLTFRISPYSFFQTNTHGTERLYALLNAWAASLGGSGALIDLYCGSGGITLSLAGRFDRVIGIDTNKEAIADARFNADFNRLSNTEFVATDVEEFLKKLPASKLSVQLAGVVVDPPRPGLHPKALHALLELNPPRIAYVSCNPTALAHDLQSLIPFYKISRVQCVDLFPHTPHVETLVALEHR